MKNSIRKQLMESVPIIFFFVFTFLFYGPISLFLPNAEELWFNLNTLLRVILPISLIALAAGILFFIIVREEVGDIFRNLLFGISVALYIQGNLINISYGSGVLDGSEIDWGSYRTYAIINSLIWAVCIFLPFVAKLVFRKKKEMIKKGIIITALFLTIIQIPAMIVQLVSYHPNTNSELKISNEGIYEVSPVDNVFVIILDGMDEEYFREYIENNPDYTKELNGFIHYDNTFASGSRTMIGVPSMLTGQPFTREETYSEYLYKVWSEKNALSVLADHGYTVKVFSDGLPYSVAATKYVTNFTTEEVKVGSYNELANKIYKLNLFKFAPHLLKKLFLFNTSEFDSAKESINLYVTDDPAFFEEFRKSTFVIDESLNHNFTLYHLNGVHSPYSMGADTSKVKNGNLEDQVAGCFFGVKNLLDDLKQKGLYENATIVITADHGDIQRGEHPILLVKNSAAMGDYITSHVPASLFDLPIFLADLVEETLPNQIYGCRLSELEEGQIRERHFFYNTSGNSRVVINEFMTTSDMDDRLDIVKIKTYEDKEGPETPYVLGTVLSFTLDATANRYSVEGFATNTGFRTMLRGPYAVYSVPIADPPLNGTMYAHFGLHHLSTDGLNIVVYAGGEEVFKGVVDSQLEKEGLNFEIKTSMLDASNQLILEFCFPDISDDELDISLKSRTSTISFVDMVINK